MLRGEVVPCVDEINFPRPPAVLRTNRTTLPWIHAVGLVDGAGYFGGARSHPSRQRLAPRAGLKAKWESIDGKHTDQEAKYKADVYVFAAHMATSHEDYDPPDLRHWRFAVLSRSELEAIGQKSISWPVVLKSPGGETSWHDLQRAVRAAMVENGDGRSKTFREASCVIFTPPSRPYGHTALNRRFPAWPRFHRRPTRLGYRAFPRRRGAANHSPKDTG